jgi:hypothetical protein
LIESTINTERHEYETNGIGRFIFSYSPKFFFSFQKYPISCKSML